MVGALAEYCVQPEHVLLGYPIISDLALAAAFAMCGTNCISGS